MAPLCTFCTNFDCNSDSAPYTAPYGWQTPDWSPTPAHLWPKSQLGPAWLPWPHRTDKSPNFDWCLGNFWGVIPRYEPNPPCSNSFSIRNFRVLPCTADTSQPVDLPARSLLNIPRSNPGGPCGNNWKFAAWFRPILPRCLSNKSDTEGAYSWPRYARASSFTLQ